MADTKADSTLQPGDVRTVLAIDPGSAKCGIAVVSSPPLRAHFQSVVPTDHLIVEIGRMLREFPHTESFVIGDGTQSATLRKAIAQTFPHLPIAVIDETGSSLRARKLYLERHPARGLSRLLPQGLRTPREPYDDIVAELLAKDFLAT